MHVAVGGLAPTGPEGLSSNKFSSPSAHTDSHLSTHVSTLLFHSRHDQRGARPEGPATAAGRAGNAKGSTPGRCGATTARIRIRRAEECTIANVTCPRPDYTIKSVRNSDASDASMPPRVAPYAHRWDPLPPVRVSAGCCAPFTDSLVDTSTLPPMQATSTWKSGASDNARSFSRSYGPHSRLPRGPSWYLRSMAMAAQAATSWVHQDEWHSEQRAVNRQFLHLKKYAAAHPSHTARPSLRRPIRLDARRVLRSCARCTRCTATAMASWIRVRWWLVAHVSL